VLRPKRAEARADLDYGRGVIVMARWLLIGVGLFLLIVKPTSHVVELRLQITLILLLALVNFFLHAQMLKRRALSEAIAYTASALDLLVITVLIVTQGGDSPVFVLYFPALLALSVAFEPYVTIVYTIATVGIYGIIATSAMPTGVDAGPIVIARMLMLGAVAFCGGLYWTVEHDRRRHLARRPS
jgi:hypothetical protein